MGVISWDMLYDNQEWCSQTQSKGFLKILFEKTIQNVAQANCCYRVVPLPIVWRGCRNLLIPIAFQIKGRLPVSPSKHCSSNNNFIPDTALWEDAESNALFSGESAWMMSTTRSMILGVLNKISGIVSNSFHSTYQWWRNEENKYPNSWGQPMTWSLSVWSQPLHKHSMSAPFSSSVVKSLSIT